MLDLQLVQACIQDRKAWETVKPHVESKNLSPFAAHWMKQIDAYYARDARALSVDLSVLKEQGLASIGPKHKEMAERFISDLDAVASPSNVVATVLDLKRQGVGAQLAAAIVSNDRDKIVALHRELGELLNANTLDSQAEWEDAVDWDDLDTIVGKDKRIPIAPKALNDRVGGGALPGHFLLVYGRPEMGKSTFSVNAAAGFLQTGQRVLYVGNEDNINVLKARMRNRLALMTPEEVDADPKKANDKAREKAGDRLKMRHLHRGRIDDLRRAIDEFEPTVLILDQIRNLEGEGDSLTKKLETTAIAVRALLARYKLVGLSVTQANDRTQNYGQEPPAFLKMTDVDSSRTGLPAQCDLMIGLGATQDMIDRDERAISLPKNKLSSKDDAHEGFIVTIDRKRSRII